MEDANAAAAAPPAAWHPDPHVPGQLRWWSGAHWTEHVKPSVTQTQAPFPVAGQSWPTPPSIDSKYRQADPREIQFAQKPADLGFTSEGESIFEENAATWTAVGISAVYLVLAVYAGIIFFGILPAYFGFQAFSKGEKLAPLGMAAAGIAIAYALTHRGT